MYCVSCVLPSSSCSPSIQVWKIGFWMKKYKSMSMKRTCVWSNCHTVGLLDLGPLTKHEKNKNVKTTKTWTGKGGKKCYQGNATLKQTQILNCKCAHSCWYVFVLCKSAHDLFSIDQCVSVALTV